MKVIGHTKKEFERKFACICKRCSAIIKFNRSEIPDSKLYGMGDDFNILCPECGNSIPLSFENIYMANIFDIIESITNKDNDGGKTDDNKD